jgi:hypothetical protein
MTQREKYLRWKTKDPERYVAYRKRDYVRRRKQKFARAKVRYATDIRFRVTDRLRSRVRRALQRNAKSGRTLELLGCSIPNFIIYIESRFEPGMTWKNIHLDHIMPCAVFDLTKPEQQKVCFHFSNYQPLFAADNIRKGAIISPVVSESQQLMGGLLEGASQSVNR